MAPRHTVRELLGWLSKNRIRPKACSRFTAGGGFPNTNVAYFFVNTNM
jgi:hypothetical protein